MISKTQLTNGIANYIKAEIIPHTPDAGTKAMMGLLATTLVRNPNLVDIALSNPIVSAMIPHDGDMWDVQGIADSLGESIREYGNLRVTIPKIPLLVPNEQVMSFSADDVSKLMGYLM